MISAVRGELFAARRRPGMWIISSLWIVLAVLFAMIIPLIVYHAVADSPSYTPAERTDLIAGALPDHIVSSAVSLYPLFGSAMMLILGTVLVGGEYRWGTFGTLLTQGPSRLATLLAKWISGAIAAFLAVLLLFAAFAGVSLILAEAEGKTITWPGGLRLIEGIGTAWLVSVAAISIGIFLAVLFRNAGTAIGVGLFWLLALENVVAQLTNLSDGLKWLPKLLLGPSAGSLAAALGSQQQGDGGVPGVVATSPVWLAVTMLAAYVLVFTGLSAALVRRRDLP